MALVNYDPQPGCTFVHQLKAGTRFRIDATEYRLLRTSDCRAFVQIMNTRHVAIKKDDGHIEEWDAPAGKTNIAPTTEVRMSDIISEGSGTVDAASKAAPVAKRGGKPAQAPLGPANKDSKRGAVLAFFMGATSVDDACKKLGMKRSLILSHLYEINRDHGVGYAVDGDKVELEMPPGITDPFAGGGKKKRSPKQESEDSLW